MGRKENLETCIRESYKLVEEYESKIPTEDDPKRELRHRQEADRQWNLIHGWLKEYLFLVTYLRSPIPDDIVQIMPKFADIIPPPEPRARVQLILEGDALPLTEERQTALKDALSGILGLSHDDVRVLQMAAGSVRVTLELPKDAADQLLLLHESRELVIAGFQVRSIGILSEQPSTPRPAPTLFPSQTWLFVGLLAMDLILVFILGWRLVGDNPNLLAYLQVASGVVGVIVTFLTAYVAVSRPVSAGAVLYRFGTDRRVPASIAIVTSLLIISVSFIPETGIPTPTATGTPTSTATSTVSATITSPPTATSTATPTATPTFIPTATSSPTTTPTPTVSPTVTPTPTTIPKLNSIPIDRYPFYVYRDNDSPDNHFSFWGGGIMGNIGSVHIDCGYSNNCHSGSTCMRIACTPASGPPYWVGISWQHPPNNWGATNEGFELEEATRLTFWARGKEGGEAVDFSMGGLGRDVDTCTPVAPYPDSVCPPVSITSTLSTTWQQYPIDLVGKNLIHVIEGFLVSIGAGDTQTIYLDEIRYECEPWELVEDESNAIVGKDSDLLQQIYAPGARVCDAVEGTCTPFMEFYQEHRFDPAIGEFVKVYHENIAVAVSGTEATVTNDSCGWFRAPEAASDERFGNIKGDRWESKRIDGQWKIVELSFNNPLTTSITYGFEDGTLGCWNLSEEGGRSLGFNLVNTGERFYTGSRSLKFNVDLQSDGEHRGRIEHRTSQPIPPLTQLSAWVLFIPSTGQATLEAEFFVWEQNGTWHVTPPTPLEPYRWTQVAWESTNLDPGNLSTPVQMLGLEVKLKGVGSLQGEIYIDDLTIR